MGYREYLVVEGELQTTYACPRCGARAKARVRTSGAALPPGISSTFHGAQLDEATERATESAIAVARRALEMSPCPACGRRAPRTWAERWTIAGALWIASAAALAVATTAPIEPVAAWIAGMAGVVLAIVAAASSAETWGAPHKVRWLEVGPEKPRKTRRKKE